MDLAWAMSRDVTDGGMATFDFYVVIGPHGAVTFRTMECTVLEPLYALDVAWHARDPAGEQCDWVGWCSIVRTESAHRLTFSDEPTWLDTLVMGWEGLFERLEAAYREQWGPDAG